MTSGFVQPLMEARRKCGDASHGLLNDFVFKFQYTSKFKVLFLILETILFIVCFFHIVNLALHGHKN